MGGSKSNKISLVGYVTWLLYIYFGLVEHVLFRLVQIQSKLTSVWTCLGQVLDASKTCPGHCIISWFQSQDMDTCCRTCGTEDAIKELRCYNIHTSTGYNSTLFCITINFMIHVETLGKIAEDNSLI